MSDLQIGQMARTLYTLNVRKKPGLHGEVLGQLSPDMEIELLESAQVDGVTWWRYVKGWVAQATADGTVLLESVRPLTNFERALRFTLRWEGGFSDDPQDVGNWTGGAVGVGVLRGTYKGISAAEHPDLDIRNLDDEEIADIYRVEYWAPLQIDAWAYAPSLMLFDASVNQGPDVAVVLKAQAGDNVLALAGKRIKLYTGYKQFSRYGVAWLNRVADALETAGQY